MNQQSLEQAFGVPFRSAKENWKGPCPFHHEVTPSFFVHKEEYVAHCFGCGISGPIDRLFVQFASTSLEEARRALDIDPGHAILSTLSRKRKQSFVAPTIFPESWLAPYKKGVHPYVLKRGFDISVLRSAGSLYDETSKRQVFPHRAADGKLLGCAGRSIKEPAEYPKWLFYWEYSKGRSLYTMRGGQGTGTHPFALVSGTSIIVVEGIFDALWLNQHGHRNVCAILGSKPSRWQIAQLREHGGPYVLGLDNDAAGEEGTEKLHKLLKRTGSVYFTPWPDDVNDWMDLDEEGIGTALDGRESTVGRRLRERGKRPTGHSGESTFTKES